MREPISSTTTETWTRRVEAWRASGERAEEFSEREGYAASTLRWWASKLRRKASAPTVQLAQVIRTVTPSHSTASSSPVIAIEASPAGVRIAVSAGADRETLAMVLDVLGVGVAR